VELCLEHLKFKEFVVLSGCGSNDFAVNDQEYGSRIIVARIGMIAAANQKIDIRLADGEFRRGERTLGLITSTNKSIQTGPTEVLQLCRSALISWADMVLAPSVAGLFKWRQFEPEVILLAVGWYLRFSLSYRGVEELLAERGLLVDHVTVWRWVQSYAPENSASIATAAPTDQRQLASGF
jgi:hypothetical protein